MRTLDELFIREGAGEEGSKEIHCFLGSSLKKKKRKEKLKKKKEERERERKRFSLNN